MVGFRASRLGGIPRDTRPSTPAAEIGASAHTGLLDAVASLVLALGCLVNLVDRGSALPLLYSIRAAAGHADFGVPGQWLPLVSRTPARSAC
jgi:hypothetical protein